MSNRIDELYDVLDEKNRQLNVANARLSEKEQEISKLQERIKLLEKNNQRQQQVIELTRLVPLNPYHPLGGDCYILSTQQGILVV